MRSDVCICLYDTGDTGDKYEVCRPLVAHHIKELSTNIRRNGDMILKRR